MSKKKRIYYCNECKKIINNIDEVLFVEQLRYRCYCSEKCIMNFYTPLIKYLEKEEGELRQKLKIEEDFVPKLQEYEKLVEQTFHSPSELWIEGEELSEELYYIIAKFEREQTFYMIIVTLMFENTPSFVLLETTTSSEELMEEYRRGMAMEEFNQMAQNEMEATEDERMGMGPEILELVEERKATFYNELVEERSEDDIPFDNYPSYEEKFLQDTLERPDEVYRHVNEGKEVVLTYIKGHVEKGATFYYLVICILYQSDFDSGEDTLIPILSFPTMDPELCRKYKRGEKIEGQSLS